MSNRPLIQQVYLQFISYALRIETLTFLFTDIEGSTRLLQELGERYAAVLSEHHRVLREAFSAYGGVEQGTQGDSFFVVFPSAAAAVFAAAAAQQALGGGQPRVRMGMHTGEAILTAEGYTGLDVHKAARIASIGLRTSTDRSGCSSSAPIPSHR
jgi:class 3 adenylate cyclase